MEDPDFTKTFKENTNHYFQTRRDYVTVHALLISWKENDIDPDAEIAALQKVLEQDYRYRASTFQIPTNGVGDGVPQLRLNTELSKFMESSSNRLDSLIIVYYAGHCSADETGEVQWAAFEDRGPTISWHDSQKLLFHAVGDVLLILDTCNAAMIAKGTKPSGRFEMIAASAKGFKTPVPGRSSFTKLLTEELRRQSQSGVSVLHLCSLLLENDRITETPVYDDLARSSPTSMILKPLVALLDPQFKRKPKGLLMLRISLSDSLTGTEIANWLKTAPPKNVSAVDIEAVIKKALCLQDAASHNIFSPGSVFGKLSRDAQDELRRRLQSLDTTMANLINEAKVEHSSGDSKTTESAFNRIDEAVSAACESVESSALLDLDPKYYYEAFLDPTLEVTDSISQLSLRDALVNQQIVAENLEIPRAKVRTVRTMKQVTIGKIEGHVVIIETYGYQIVDDEQSLQRAETQIRRISDLLCRPKSSNFHILPGLGFFQDKGTREFGMAFQPPVYFDENDSINSLLEIFKKYKVVSLTYRLQLVKSLCMAINSLHKVGWVHKGLRSDKILIFDKPQASIALATTADFDGESTSSFIPPPVDFARPFLFGFEYSRPDQDPTHLDEDFSLKNNIYRHPERWGRPLIPFRYAHDIYSLGVIIFEIAFWKDISAILGSEKNRIVASEVKREIIRKCMDRVPHMTGDMLASVILICLDFDEQVKGKSEYEAQMFFQRRVLDKLKQATGKV